MRSCWSRLYAAVIRASTHPHAVVYLCALAFAEASFFPVPPDVMLVPMVLARPWRARPLAGLTTVFSVLGGIGGYAIGFFVIDSVSPILHTLGYWQSYLEVSGWFAHWGFWTVLLAGFSPIPYKVFTIASGAAHMQLPAFAFAALIGRGLRFYLEAILVSWAGPRVEPLLRRYMDALGWAMIGAIAIAILVYWL